MSNNKYKNKEYNLNIHIGELTSTLFCHSGYSIDNLPEERFDKVIGSLLYLKGMDVAGGFVTRTLSNGEKFRLSNNQVVSGGILYSGYQRDGYDSSIGEALLETPKGVLELARVLGLSKED